MTTDRAKAERLLIEGKVKLLKNEDLAFALARFEAAIEADPSFSEPYVQKGNCQRLLGQTDAAINSYTEAISRDAEYVQAYLSRAYAFLEKGGNRFAALAVRDYETFLALGGGEMFSHTLEVRGMEGIVESLKPLLQQSGDYPPQPYEPDFQN